MKVSDKPSKREHQSTATNNQKLKKGFKRYLVGRKGVDSSLSPGARRTTCASLAHQLHLRLPLFFCWISVQQPNQQGTKAGRALKTEDLQVLLVSHTHTHTCCYSEVHHSCQKSELLISMATNILAAQQLLRCCHGALQRRGDR